MTDRDYFWLSAAVLALAIGGLIDARTMRRQDQELAQLRHDVEYLKDNTIARETEARP